MALALLTACIAPTPPVNNVVVQKCPSIKPGLKCPAWDDDMPKTLRQLQESWLRGREANRSCDSAVTVWEESWEVCGKLVDKRR